VAPQTEAINGKLATMAVLGGILGALAGFGIGVLIHVAFWNDEGWADVIPFVLAVLGVLTGVALGRSYGAGRGGT
jgi:hypothetical protein